MNIKKDGYNMNITIDQIIETLKDENKRKQIEEIICGEKDNVFPYDLHYDYFYIESYMLPEYRKKLDNVNYVRNENNHNKFETKEECEKMARKINAELKLYHIAKHLNKGWTPDWNNRCQEKWKLNYDHAHKEYICLDRSAVDDAVIYFKSKHMLPDIIRLMGEQSLKDYFMIEEN